MLSVSSRDFLKLPIKEFIIPSEKVAHVQLGNNTEHALLVLTKTGYSSIPVLDMRYRMHGMISVQQITDEILGLDRIEYERLDSIKVDEVMTRDFVKINERDTFQRALDLLINHPYVCVVGDEDTFLGIMTRRVVMKQLKKQLYLSLD
ncbi:cyclic-di-AMP-binding protein CbpB [Chryseomicrobium sp. FSL W7-1435]|uniref:cyclic-di-AMP-binding protein CbpB n=1 Tax=Chryseomicrobium sp. FSL W7-1435 TaxID=2921704 RepID=UPI00315A48ED